jgi:hypothetical protein
MERKETDTPNPGGTLFAAGPADRRDVRTFVSFFVAAGLVNATIVALLLCHVPDARTHSLRALLTRAALYVVVSAAGGIAGAYFYWRRSFNPFRLVSPISFRDFSLICAAAWVWVPAATLLSTQDSGATAVIGLLCGAILGTGLRQAIGDQENSQPSLSPFAKKELFAATLEPIPRDSEGYWIALGVFAAGYAQHEDAHLLAALLCAAAAFLFGWSWKEPTDGIRKRVRQYAGRRLAWTAILAVLLTTWALMLGGAHRNASSDAAMAASEDGGGQKRPRPSEPALGPGGFQSVILWPFPPKKQLIPPVPAPVNYLGPERAHPLTIRFDGAYWYFEPPDTGPGWTAHQAQGTPLGVNIESVNSFPLMMEAHQQLIGPVRLSRCGEIDVVIENRDNLRGAISLGLLLGDSHSPGKPTLYLGQKEIETTLSGFFYYKTAPVSETLRFAIPRPAPMRRFDEITVMVLPDPEHSMAGPKIAIQEFDLLPR